MGRKWWLGRQTSRVLDTRQVEDLKGLNEPTIFNLGISADNSADILKRVETETVARTRHENSPLVVIQIGINDSCKENGKPQQTIEQYKNNLREITNKLGSLGSKVIFVGFSCCEESKTTPVFWGEYYCTNKDIKSYEQSMGEIAKELDVSFIPVFDAFSQVYSRDPSLLPDGLHPNAAGHQAIFDIVKPRLLELIEKEGAQDG